MRLLFLIAALLVAACGTLPQSARPPQPTLLFLNETGSPVRVYVGARFIGIADPGANCMELKFLRPAGNDQLGFRMLATPEIEYTDRRNFAAYSGWMMRLGRNPRIDMLSLRPTVRCREVR